MNYIAIVLSFLGSFGLFIFGITLLSSSLQKAAGSKAKHVLGNVSKSRFRGVIFGAGVTAVMQGSTATTVMAVGFVNAGIIALPQVVGIIMGANIGSTATSWLVSSVEWSVFLRPAYVGAVSAAAGALILLFSKNVKVKQIGEVIVGFGVLFLGLSQMPAAVRPLAELSIVQEMFITMGSNPILGILTGMLVVAILQSSAVSIGILQSMAIAGMVPWNAAVFLIIGQNIGSCFTAILSSVGTSKNAQAASYIHLIYNVFGAIIFGVGAVVFFTFINPILAVTPVSATYISMFHTGYNVAAFVLLFPLGQLILKIASKMAGLDKVTTKDDKSELSELDESILQTPSFAIENSITSINMLIELIRANIELGVNIFLNREYKNIDSFWANANAIDKVNEKISTFLTMLYNEKLSEEDTLLVTSLLHVLISLKRMSNRTKGFAKLAKEMQDGDVKYSNTAALRIKQIFDTTLSCYDNMSKAFKYRDVNAITQTIQEADMAIEQRENYKNEHLALASSGGYKVQTGIVFSEAARHLARIANNLKSLVEYIPIDDVIEDRDIEELNELSQGE